MTLDEFSDTFDVLYNNISSNQAPGIDEYEKSVFLTKAQDEIVKSYFDPLLNKVQEGFDSFGRRQIDFSMIIVNKLYTDRILNTEPPAKPLIDLNPVDPNPDIPTEHIGDFFEPQFDTRKETKAAPMEKDILMIINEYVIVNRNDKETRLEVIPITYTEYSRMMSRPYKRPLKWQAWRLINSTGNKRTVELIVGPGDEIKEYNIRYVRGPRPIILPNVDRPLGGLIPSKDWEITEGITCELDPIMHQDIVQRAAEMASAVYKGDLTTQIALGQASQTNVGAVSQSNARQ